jgi:hypothetical protein
LWRFFSKVEGLKEGVAIRGGEGDEERLEKIGEGGVD